MYNRMVFIMVFFLIASLLFVLIHLNILMEFFIKEKKKCLRCFRMASGVRQTLSAFVTSGKEKQSKARGQTNPILKKKNYVSLFKM